LNQTAPVASCLGAVFILYDVLVTCMGDDRIRGTSISFKAFDASVQYRIIEPGLRFGQLSIVAINLIPPGIGGPCRCARGGPWSESSPVL